MPFQCSYYFETKDVEGWSENLFITAANIDDAATAAGTYIPLRMALSPNNVDMVFAKVSDTSVKGDSLIAPGTGGGFPYVGTYTETPTGCFLEANTALLIEILATPSKKNRLFLRGLSLDVVTGREFVNPSGFATALAPWLNYLKTGVMVRTQNKPHTHPPTYTYAAATDAYFQRVTARRPGRPFDTLRGRKFSHRA